jgi:hypothetical protein
VKSANPTLGCLAPVLTIAAVLGGRSPFVAPLEKRDEADAVGLYKSSSQLAHSLKHLEPIELQSDLLIS